MSTLTEGPRHAAPLRLLAAAAATFGVALGLFAVLGGSGGAARPRPLGAVTFSVSAPGGSTDARIARLQALLRLQPREVDALSTLAGAYLQKVRETADPAYYDRAGTALRRALALRPADAGALTERGALELSRHHFRAALADAQRVRALAPEVNKPFGVLVDALVELGRYGAAGRALQAMVDLKPNLDAYARVSYFRELHGDLPGAASALFIYAVLLSGVVSLIDPTKVNLAAALVLGFVAGFSERFVLATVAKVAGTETDDGKAQAPKSPPTAGDRSAPNLPRASAAQPAGRDAPAAVNQAPSAASLPPIPGGASPRDPKAGP